MKKKLLVITVLIFLITAAYCQSSSIIVNGGWATAAPDDSDLSFDGFKAGIQYEYVMGDNHWATGGSFHYLGFKDSGNITTTHYRSLPLSFYGKYLIGKNKLQGYLKGVTGMQFFMAKRETLTGEELKDHDFGFTLGTGAGVNYTMNEKIFLNLDYELLYLTNAFYDKGLTNAITVGVGFKLH